MSTGPKFGPEVNILFMFSQTFLMRKQSMSENHENSTRGDWFLPRLR